MKGSMNGLPFFKPNYELTAGLDKPNAWCKVSTALTI